MKRFISIILVFTMFFSTMNISFAAEIEYGDILAYKSFDIKDDSIPESFVENFEGMPTISYAEPVDETILPTDTIKLQSASDEVDSSLFSDPQLTNTDFTFDANLMTSFNTVIGPQSSNGANEPKFSYGRFLEENISDYSGELTLNFEDIVLDGRNGLDLRIGRTYQSIASIVGERTLMILPDENDFLHNYLICDYSNYLIDRYNLGMGWSFSFPSVQVETEYIPEEFAESYYYDEETELYYHSGNGEVYRVRFTNDTTDSNLKGYYNKDIQFNKNDEDYSNGQVTSFYSLTLSDKTKQYFAEDGRLIGIVDRFGNTIKFEHELHNLVNRMPNGTFKTETGSNEMWESSKTSSGADHAVYREDDTIGSNDGFVMHFKYDNSTSYIISQPTQVKPYTDYEFGMRFKSLYGEDMNIEVIGYDTAYNPKQTKTFLVTGYEKDVWTDFSATFKTSSAVRYVQIKINPERAKSTYIDSVSLEEPKPLISKITDSIGRIVEFDYAGSLYDSSDGEVSITVTSPDGASSRTLNYGKEAAEFGVWYDEYQDYRKFWFLTSSNTEGEDGASVFYEYKGGAIENEDGTLSYVELYFNHSHKEQYSSDSCINNTLLSGVRYKDRKKIYEYETVRKHLGDGGYYDTLRIRKKYDQYTYVPEGDTKSHFKGELGAVNYSYTGICSGNSFDNETGYPDFTFDDETALNELWTVTKTGKSTDTITFSNCEVIRQTSSSSGTVVSSDYTNHSIFKNSPVQIKNTVTQNGESKDTYVLYSYNDWGGVASETKEIDESIKNNTSLLEKYTTTYQYNDFHYITQKDYYNNLDSPQVSEINTFNSNGLLTSSENAAKEKTYYYYENETYPFLITSAVTKDPMRFHNLKGEDRAVIYSYDAYGLYPLRISEDYEGGASETSYVYDYITGDILRETLPDDSYTDYKYYSDGRIKSVISPFTQYIDGRLFYTIEQHIYKSNVITEGYGLETQTFDWEQIIKYIRFPDESTAKPYLLDWNFYDAVGNLKQNKQYYFKDDDSSIAYLKSTTQYYRDIYDRLTKTVDNENYTVAYAYDGFDRPVTITDSENNIYCYAYDSVQNKVDLTLNGATELTDRNLVTQYFDLYGNVIENVVYPDNSSQTLSEFYEYDLNNNTIKYTNANGNETKYLYDAANRLKETILPNGVKATSSYSVFDKPTFEKIYDSDGIEKSARITYQNEKGDTNLRFFNFDRRMVDTDSYLTDVKGRITNIKEGENQKSVLYDELDHPIVMTSGESQIHRRYDQFGEIAAASTNGNIPEIRYGYDYVGNLNEKLQNNVHYMAYAYSGLGNIMQSTMPSERTESYTYTANGNLDTIISDGKTFDYDYYDTGYVKSITYPGGLKTTYEYNNINRITKVMTTKDGSSINTFEYEYDNNGNTTKEIRNGAATSYSYDELDRLISVNYNDGSSVTYEYDALNNRTKETYSNGDVKDYVYDAKYQLKEIKLNGQITDTFTYNESGAVVTHNDKTYTYDEWDRMSGYSDGTDTYTYKYDANGIRTQKNDKQYVVDINNNVVAETDNTGTITDEILWGHQPLARKVNGSWYYYIYNAHGDVVGLVNDSGTVVNTYEYTPWGEIRSESETVDNPIKYAGEYYDDELDMIYLRARYYDPQIGRFTSLDIEEGEISNPLDMNRYVYCRNNPIKYVDPSGMFVISTSVLVGISIGALIGAVAGALIGVQTAEKLNITGNNKLLFVAGLGLGGAVIGGVIGSVIGYGVHAALGTIAGSMSTLSATTNALSKLEPRKINHILNGSKGKDHMWYKIMKNVTWDNVKPVIADTMNKGTTTLIGKGNNGEMIYEALMTVKSETVRVSYSVVDGIIKLGDAWVVKK